MLIETRINHITDKKESTGRNRTQPSPSYMCVTITKKQIIEFPQFSSSATDLINRDVYDDLLSSSFSDVPHQITKPKIKRLPLVNCFQKKDEFH